MRGESQTSSASEWRSLRREKRAEQRIGRQQNRADSVRTTAAHAEEWSGAAFECAASSKPFVEATVDAASSGTDSSGGPVDEQAHGI